jgi:hypothetical protein
MFHALLLLKTDLTILIVMLFVSLQAILPL